MIERRRKEIANLGEFRAQALELGTGEPHRRFLIEGNFAFVAQMKRNSRERAVIENGKMRKTFPSIRKIEFRDDGALICYCDTEQAVEL